MKLEEAISIVNDKCDVDLPRLKSQYRNAIQLVISRQAARGLAESNGTIALIKDELNRLINEKGLSYLAHYAQIFPLVDDIDYDSFEEYLFRHFNTKLDRHYSEGCHQLDDVKQRLKFSVSHAIHLNHDYENATRGWHADIRLLVAKLKAEKMKAQPQIVYNLYGSNSRVNNDSVDSSVNIVNLSDAELFENIRKAIGRIADPKVRDQLAGEIDALHNTTDKADKADKYLNFIQHAANHITLLAPFFPALAQWASQ